MSSANENELRLVCMGGGGVGKSALTIRFVTGNFLDEYDPTIEDSYRKQIELDGVPWQCDILDTAGQEEFSSMQDQWIRDAQGFFLIYSITNRSSFSEIEHLYAKVCRIKDSDSVPCLVVGNKCDLEAEREVLLQEGRDAARSCRSPFIETSAKHKINLDEMFYTLCRLVIASRADPSTEVAVSHGCFPCVRKKRAVNNVVQLPQELSVVAMGDGGVGKSSLVLKFVISHVPEEIDPTIEDSYRKQLEVDGKMITLDVLDTAGQEEFSSMRDGYLRSGDCFLLVYDITNRSSFENVSQIYEQILRVKDSDSGGVPCIIVGNKTDLESSRRVLTLEGQDLARTCGNIGFLETSAITQDTTALFASVVREYMKVNFASVSGQKQAKAVPKAKPKPVKKDDDDDDADVVASSKQQYHTGAIWCQLLVGNVLYTGSRDCTARAWNVRTGEHLMCFLGHTSRVYSLAVYKELLATGSGDATVRVWNVVTGACLLVLRGHEDKRSICSLVFDAGFIYSASTDQTVRVWNSSSGECMAVLPCESKLNALVLHNNTLFAGCLESHDVKVFQLRHEQRHNSLVFAPQLISQLKGHSNYVMHVIIRLGSSGRPSLVFTASSDKTIRSWDLASLKLQTTFEGHKDWVNAIAATEHLLFSGSRDHTAKCWDITTGRCVRDFLGHTNSVRALAVSAIQGDHSFRVATAGKDLGVRIWHSSTGECMWLFEGCEDWINCLSISGTVVFAGCRDNTVRSWDMHSGILQRIFFDRKRARWGELQPRVRVLQGSLLLIIEFLQLVSFALNDSVKWVSQPFTNMAPLVQLDLRRYQVDPGVAPMLIGVLLLLVCYLSAYKIYAWRTLWSGGVPLWRVWCLVCKLCSTIFFIPICKPLVFAALCTSEPRCYESGTGELGLILLLMFLPPAFRLAAVDGRLDKLAFYFWNPFVLKHDHADLRRIHPFSRCDPRFERHQLLFALAMIIVSAVFIDIVKDAVGLQVALVVCALLMCLNTLRCPPYHDSAVVGARFGSFAGVAVFSVLGLANALSPGVVWTVLSFVLTPLTFLMAFSLLRWHHGKKLKRKELTRQTHVRGGLLLV